jgi:crotonobetainyl-CoA:carnitine CoA-transferase CaiB-like acyl-CoA transferase
VGLPRVLGERGAPPLRFGSNYAGVASAMYAMQAILAALFWRNRSGEGQAIHSSYLSGMIATEQNYLTSSSDPDGEIRGFPVSHLEPPSQGLETMDQRVEMGFNYARDPEAIDKLFEWLGALDKVRADHPEVVSRHLGNQDTQMLRPYLVPALKTKTYPEVYDKMMELGIQWAPVHTYETMYADPGILEQDVVRTVEHPVRGTVKEVSPSWQIDDAPADIRLAPPLLGEHTDEILGEIGYDAAKIAAVHTSNVVR